MRPKCLPAMVVQIGMLALCFLLVTVRGAGAATAMQKIVPAYSDEVLDNPGMGIYCHATPNASDLPADAWFLPLVQIGYHRDDWASLQNAGDGEGAIPFR